MATAVAHGVTALAYLSMVAFFGSAILLWSALVRIRATRRLARSLSSVLQCSADSTQDLLDLALNEAIGLTRSRIGYLYFHQLDRQELLLRSWSREVMQEATSADPASRFDPSMTTGILNDVVHTRRPVILNDFQARYPLARGYPDGHAALRRVLALPVFSADRIVAVVAVANKAGAYDAVDIERLRLLLTDVVMPEMNGRDLCRTLLVHRPKLKCLFMSGYTADVIAHHGVLDDGVSFLQKPFTTERLAARVRDVLDRQPALGS